MSEAGGYTQIPNGILDRMHEMTGAEFKVVCAIARQTLGWHKTRDTISISQIEQLTGLSRQSVIDGINRAVKDGFIRKSESGYSYSYEITDETTAADEDIDASQKIRLVKKLDQSKNLTSLKIRPKLVKKLDSQKKERNKTLSYERGDEQSSLALDIPEEHIEQPSSVEQKPARAKRQPDQNQQHGACLIYQELTGRHPNRVQAAQIAEHISDIERWRAIVTKWLSSGYKTTNVEGMLDWYRKNGSSNGRNGNGQASRGYEKPVQVGAEGTGKPNPERAVIRPISTDDW